MKNLVTHLCSQISNNSVLCEWLKATERSQHVLKKIHITRQDLPWTFNILSVTNSGDCQIHLCLYKRFSH